MSFGTLLFCFIRHFKWYYYKSLWGKLLFSLKLLRNQQVFLPLVTLRVITVRTIGVHHPHHWCWVSARWYDMIKGLLWLIHYGEKIRCIITVKTPLRSLLPRTSPPQNTLFLTFIPISLIIYNKRNIQNESSCHSCHKRTAYNLLTYSTFTRSVKSDSKMKLKILSLYRYIF